MRLTRPNILKLTLPAEKAEAISFDDALPGFGVRLRAGGKRTWIVQYRLGSKQRRVTLGTVEALDPDRARQAAKETLAKVQLGGDPQIEKAEMRSRAALTTGVVVQRYLETIAQHQRERSFKAAERYLTRLWGLLEEIPVARVHRATIASRLIEIARDHGPVTANRARQCLSAFFGWAMREGLTDTNPVSATNKAVEETSRERVLTDEELAAIWRACPDDSFGAIVRLLMLTGQRREEVGGLLRSEINLQKALWSLPPHRTKNSRAHEVPLSPSAVEILTQAMEVSTRTVLFGYEERPFTGWSSAKTALDKRLKEAGTPIEDWRLHDLRRTAATRIADMGALPQVIEAILNHISGHKAGVAGVYNRSTYAKEKREALDLWAAHIQALVKHEAPDREEVQKVAPYTSNEVQPVARSPLIPTCQDIATLGNTETIPVAPAKLTLINQTVRVRDLKPVLNKPRPKRRGRPPIKKDKLILEKMAAAMNEDETLDDKQAAEMFAHEVLGNSLESTIDRLVRKFREYQKKGIEISSF